MNSTVVTLSELQAVQNSVKTQIEEMETTYKKIVAKITPIEENQVFKTVTASKGLLECCEKIRVTSENHLQRLRSLNEKLQKQINDYQTDEQTRARVTANAAEAVANAAKPLNGNN